MVFLDMDVPDEDGVAAVMSFRAIDPARKVPVYSMTARPPHTREANGIAGVLRKPFSIREIETIILGISSGDGTQIHAAR